MHTPPSRWLVTGMAVGAFAAVVASATHVLQQAILLP
jgi:hypothetical protein